MRQISRASYGLIRHRLIQCGLAGLLITSTAFAEAYKQEVYKQVDDKGNVTYSDKPAGQEEAFTPPPITTIQMPKPQPDQGRNQDKQPPAAAAYKRVYFIYPEAGSAFESGNGDVTFQFAAEPDLKSGHQFELKIDGAQVTRTRDTSYLQANLDRGTHQATLSILTYKGEPLISTQLSFTLHRHSVLHPKRAP